MRLSLGVAALAVVSALAQETVPAPETPSSPVERWTFNGALIAAIVTQFYQSDRVRSEHSKEMREANEQNRELLREVVSSLHELTKEVKEALHERTRR